MRRLRRRMCCYFNIVLFLTLLITQRIPHTVKYHFHHIVHHFILYDNSYWVALVKLYQRNFVLVEQGYFCWVGEHVLWYIPQLWPNTFITNMCVRINGKFLTITTVARNTPCGDANTLFFFTVVFK